MSLPARARPRPNRLRARISGLGPRLVVASICTFGLLFQSACQSRCQDGFTELNGICYSLDGGLSASCDEAPAGLYEGITDQGLPFRFELAEDRSRIVNLRFMTVLSGPGNPDVSHEVSWDPGFSMLGCGFAGVVQGSEVSGAFVPPGTFAGIWADSFQPDAQTLVSSSGTWTATSVAAGDGGQPDGGALDAGTPEDGGVDGGPPDAGAVDAGAADGGGGAAEISVPAGFSAEVVARDLAGPSAVTVDPDDGALYVAELYGGRVQRVHGGQTQPVLTSLVQPRGLSLVPGTPKRLYASHEGGIQVLELGGAESTFGPTLAFPPGPLTCDSSPRCVVAELRFGERRQAVWRVKESSAEMIAGMAQGIDQPVGLLATPSDLLIAEGNLGFASSDGVLFHVVGGDGGVSGFTPVPLIAQPGALASIGGSLILVSEVNVAAGGSRQVWLLDRDARTSRAFASGFSLPVSLTYDAARSRLFIADLARGFVVRIDGPFGNL